jgi:hypothetical protein
MVRRRALLAGGILGGLTGSFGARSGTADAAEPAVQRQTPDEDFREIVAALDKLRQQLAEQRTFVEIGAIRDAQRNFLRTNQKMPDFIEVGANHWFQLYDWHVRWQQPLNLGRDGQGRYTILFMGTTVILRPENQDSFMSAPYDVR